MTSSPTKLYSVAPDPVTGDPKVSLNLHSGQTKVWDSTARFVFMLAGTQCVHPNSLVWMADGKQRRICRLKPGDKIINLDEDKNEIAVDTVTASFSSGQKETFQVTTAGWHRIIVTAEHPLYGTNGWTQLKDLKPGDPIMVTGNEFAQWDTIQSIEPQGIQPVWDITAERHHNFIANDIFCHNSGKTSFGPWWLWREIQTRGQGDYLAVTSTFDIFSLKMLPEMQQVFERVLEIGKYWSGSGIIEICDLDPESPNFHKFTAKRGTDPMWARIILRSASAEGGLESATAKAAWLDEVGQDAFSLGAWEAILRRLSLNQGRVLGTTTLYNMGWLKQQAYDPWVKGDTTFDIIQFDSTSNPSFPQEEYDRAKRTMPAWRFDLFYRGRFARPPGLIYSDYIEEFHMVKPFAIPMHWHVFVGVDFGGVNTATVWLAQDPVTEKFYIFRTSLEGDMSAKQHTDKFHERAKGLYVARVVGGAGNEEQYRLDWQGHHVPVEEPPFKDVENGIDRVVGLFKADMLYVFEPLGELRHELATYSREVDKDTGEVLEGIKDKNRYHILDSLRYICTVLGNVQVIPDPEAFGQPMVNRFTPDRLGVPPGELLSEETINVLRHGGFDHTVGIDEYFPN